MPTVEERVNHVEAGMTDLRNEMHRGFERIDARLEAIDLRFGVLERRMDRLEYRMDRLEDRMEKFEARMDSRFNHFDARLLSLEQKVDRQFVWLVGIQLTTMITVVGVLAAAYVR